jgi:tRNA(Ile)-lysidine synthase
VVMAFLFHLAGYKFAIAHCNFKLRGEESETDSKFVKQLAGNLNVDFLEKSFDTTGYASENNLSIQEAARNLRYAWFEEIATGAGYEVVALAHHAGDNAETILFNLTRGAGLAGLHGIRAKRGIFYRPLLFADKEEIRAYAISENLKWCDDSSNSTDHYARNKIRHSVIPALKEINPSLEKSLSKFSDMMLGYEKIIENYIAAIKSELLNNTDTAAFSIDLLKLLSGPAPKIILYHLINKFGFNAAVCDSIVESSRIGSEFIVPGYRLVRGRNELTLIETAASAGIKFAIAAVDAGYTLRDGILELNTIALHGDISSITDLKDSSVAYLDKSKLKFPLNVRKWQHGDYFYPYGTGGKKLVSDFITDQKFSVYEKEVLHLLLSGNDIAWLIGYRIDDRFKINNATMMACRFTFKQ